MAFESLLDNRAMGTLDLPGSDRQALLDRPLIIEIIQSVTQIAITSDDRVNTENYQQFLDDFSQKYPNDFHVVQTDNATF